MCMTSWQRGQLEHKVLTQQHPIVCRTQSTKARLVSDKVLTGAIMRKSLSCAPDLQVYWLIGMRGCTCCLKDSR